MHPATVLCRWAATVALCAGLSGTAVAAGGYVNLAEQSPGAKFNDDDMALMLGRVKQALRADQDGEMLEWKSVKTPASGSVTALDRFSAEGMACRRLRIHNAYGELKAEGVYRFCEKPGKGWKLVGPDKSPTK
jgi:surface antigen